jgi:Flp pilus assembly protein TadD
MILKFLCDNKLGAKLCIAMLGLALFLSCQSPAEREKQLFARDSQTLTQLQQINSELNIVHMITPTNFEILKRLHAKYPRVSEVAKSYKAALAIREDWDELAKILIEIPAAERTRDDHILLSKVLIKLGRFEESSGILQSINAAPNDVEVRSLSALARFSQGQMTEAAADLDAVWDAIISNKRIEEINLRGMIHFRQKDHVKAAETLKKSLELVPLNPVATNTLSRIYAASGDADNAERYRKETENAQNAMTAGENKKLQFVSLSKRLETAWNTKEYDKVLSIAKEMLPLSDENNKAALQKYIESAEVEIKKQGQK